MKYSKCPKCDARSRQGTIAIDVMYCDRSARDIRFCDGIDRLEYDKEEI